jgi:hypothetical protein
MRKTNSTQRIVALVALGVVTVVMTMASREAPVEARTACEQCNFEVDQLCDRCNVVNGSPGWSNDNCVNSCLRDNNPDDWDERPCIRQVDGDVKACNEGCRGNSGCEGNCGGQYKTDRLNACHGVRGQIAANRQGCLNSCAGTKNAIEGCRGYWCGGGKGAMGQHDSCNGRAICKGGTDAKCTPAPNPNNGNSYAKVEGCGLVIKDDADSCKAIDCPKGKIANCWCQGSGFYGISQYRANCECK